MMKEDWAGFEKIRLITEYEGDVVVKAHLFDEAKKMDTPMTDSKSVLILSKYAGRIEEALKEMRKIWPGHGIGSSKPSGPPSSQPSAHSPLATLSGFPPNQPPGSSPRLKPFIPPSSPVLKSPPPSDAFAALKERMQERRIQEALATAAAIQVPSSIAERAASSEPSGRKGKKVKVPPPAEDEVETVSSSTGEETDDDGEPEGDDEPSSPEPERPSLRTRAANKKTPPVPKRKRKTPAKSPKKDGSSTKKGRKK